MTDHLPTAADTLPDCATNVPASGPGRRSRSRPKVTASHLACVAAFLKTMGVKVGEVEIKPDRVRIITTDGRNLTLDDDDGTLDQELMEHRKNRGYGAP
jgi:hypothetical protein